jgi:hypothetical protein
MALVSTGPQARCSSRGGSRAAVAGRKARTGTKADWGSPQAAKAKPKHSLGKGLRQTLRGTPSEGMSVGDSFRRTLMLGLTLHVSSVRRANLARAQRQTPGAAGLGARRPRGRPGDMPSWPGNCFATRHRSQGGANPQDVI